MGWSFKKNTNDSRESAAIYVSENLLSEGADLFIYDPVVKKKKIISDLRTLFESNSRLTKELDEKIFNIKTTNKYNGIYKPTKNRRNKWICYNWSL